MATPTVNNLQLINATITEQSVGAWHASVDVDGTEALSGTATIAIDGATWVGTVVRSKFEHQHVRAKIVGGKGKLSTELAARGYGNITLARVLSDWATDAGETLSSTCDSLTSNSVDSWHRGVGKASDALQEICDRAGMTWRVLRDGTIWVGVQTWTATTAKPTELDSDWTDGCFELRDGQNVQPGTTYSGEQITLVKHTLEGGRLYTEARVNSTNGVLERIIERTTRRMNRSTVWPAQVTKCTSTSSSPADLLQCVTDDERMKGRGLDRAFQIMGLPGCLATFPTGVRGLVTFAEGDPDGARWVGWAPDCSATTIKLTTATSITFESVVINLGLGATEAAILGNLFMTLYNAHSHPTGTGPSGPPAVLMSATQLSSKVKVG